MKNIIKKIFGIFLLIVIALSPVLLTGCLSTGVNAGTNTGGESGGETGGETGGNIMLNAGDYFDGFKVSFDTSYDNAEVFLNDLYDRVYELSENILLDLYSEYGFLIPVGGVNYEGADYFVNGTNPFMSKAFTITDDYGVETSYVLDERFSHANAIGKDSPIDETNYNMWNWTYESNMSSSYQLSFISFMFNTKNIQKLSLAIIMIMSDKEVQDVSSADYTEYVQITNGFSTKTDTEIEQTIKNYAKNLTHTGLFDEEQTKLKEFILNVIIGSDLVELDMTRFVATPDFISTPVNNYGIDSSWGFYADETYFTYDIYTSLYENPEDTNADITNYGNYVIGQMEFHQPYTVSSFFYYDLNETGKFEASTSENTNIAYAGFYRLSYFKNYVSTVKSILNKYFPINYANMGINDVIFPLTSSGYYRDFTVGDLEMDLNSTPFVMSTGAQNYKNMVIMPNKTVQLKDMALAVQSTTNFSLTVYVKYHTTTGWASWGTGGATTDMYNVGTYSMKKGTYNPMSSTANDFSIDMANILKTAQINGVTKNNCVINPFLNNTESYDSSTLLTLSYDGSTHFKPIQNSTNEIDNIDYVDNASEYVEIIFEASPEVLYQLGVLMFYFDIV